jgi:transposase
MTKNKSTSNEDRERIISSYINGSSTASISQVLNIKRTTVHMIIKKYNDTCIIESEKKGGNKSEKLNQEQKNYIKQKIDDDCTLSLKKSAI